MIALEDKKTEWIELSRDLLERSKELIRKYMETMKETDFNTAYDLYLEIVYYLDTVWRE